MPVNALLVHVVYHILSQRVIMEIGDFLLIRRPE